MSQHRRVRSSLRVGALVGIVALLAACGSDGDQQVGDQLPLPGDAPAGTGSFLLDVAVDTPYGRLIADEQQGIAVDRSSGFVTDGLSAPATAATVFDLDPNASLDDVDIDARAVALAEVFGVSGDVQRVGDGREIGTVGELVLVVNSPRGGDGGAFWFEGGPELQAGLTPCPTLPDGFCENGASTEPPASTERAEQQIASVMTTLGLESDSYIVDRFDQSTSVEFGVMFAPNGQRSSVQWGFSVGSSGELAAAYGPFTVPQPVVEVPLIDIDTAIDRLHGMNPGFDAVPPPTTVLAAAPGLTAPEAAPPPDFDRGLDDSIETTTSLPVPDATDRTDDTVFVTTTMFDQPETTMLPTTTLPTTVPQPPSAEMPGEFAPSPSRNIVGVELGLQTFWESAGGPWLLPAFVFVADDGTEYGIVGVAAPEFVVTSPVPTLTPPTTMLEGYVPIPEPMPTLLSDDGTPQTIPVPPLDDTGSTEYYNEVFANVLVGRDLASVVNTLEGSGWTVRIIDEDVLDQTVAADLRWDRANVLHRNEIVTAVYADPWVPGSSPAASAPSQTSTSATSTTTSTTITTTTTTSTSQPAGALPATTTGPPTEPIDDWLDAEGRAELQRGLESLWVGGPVDSARGALESIGYIVRVVGDGDDMTADLVAYRVNLGERDGIVEWVSVG